MYWPRLSEGHGAQNARLGLPGRNPGFNRRSARRAEVMTTPRPSRLHCRGAVVAATALRPRDKTAEAVTA